MTTADPIPPGTLEELDATVEGIEGSFLVFMVMSHWKLGQERRVRLIGSTHSSQDLDSD